ncbi:MAG TPA: efflux RND transporter periplasmic adaptor subunit, partial [Usitatibacter sp.]|nr:efflux RND transporter periplasmic adaptor subunit [Usitatibacter sp.]
MKATFALCVLVASACISCGDREHETARDTGKAAERGKPLVLSEEDARRAGLKTGRAIVAGVDETFTASGTILANQDRLVRILPRAPGRIVRASVAAGSDVRAGQELAQVESPEIGEARSAWLQARSEHEVAQAALRRAETLFREQVIPEKEFLRARGDAQRTSAAFHAAEAKLAMLGADTRSTRATTADAIYTLTAPFAGTVLDKKAVLGELTQPDQPLFTIADLREVWVEMDLAERDLAGVRRGAAVVVRVAAYPEQAFNGRLGYIADTVDKTSRTVKGRVVIPNPDRRLKPGMLATVAVQMPRSVKGIVLPATAVVLLQGQATAFVREGDSFEPKPIES